MVLECSRFRCFFYHTLVIYLSFLTLLFTKRNWGSKTRKRGYINLPAFYRLWCKLIVFSPCYLLITDSARSLTVCGCKQNKMKTSICLVANFWTASILQLKKLFYSFSISIAWKWIRASLSSTITRQKSGISNENPITQYSIRCTSFFITKNWIILNTLPLTNPRDRKLSDTVISGNLIMHLTIEKWVN